MTVWNRRQRRLMLVGALYDGGFGLPIFLAPLTTMQLLGLPAPDRGIIWLRLDGIFLIILALLYLTTAIDPNRYLGNIVVAMVGKVWSVAFYTYYVMALGEAPLFMMFAGLDVIMFFLHFWAIGPDRWARIRTAFQPPVPAVE